MCAPWRHPGGGVNRNPTSCRRPGVVGYRRCGLQVPGCAHVVHGRHRVVVSGCRGRPREKNASVWATQLPKKTARGFEARRLVRERRPRAPGWARILRSLLLSFMAQIM